ncbi:MAG: tetratricopeptide repeat protein [Bacillota bacterium]
MTRAGTRTTTVPAAAAARTAQPFSFTFAFWGLMSILFVSPYLRGLFFPDEQHWALITAAVLFFFVWVGKVATHENRMFEHPLDYLMPALPALYLFSAFFAVNTGAAVNEIARALLYFLAFWIAARVITSADDLHRVFHVLYLSAAGVALAGLATATGIIEIPDGFLGGRIYSTFQYPNALANYLMAVLFLGFYLWQRRVVESGSAGLPAQAGKKPAAGEGLPAWMRFDPYPYYYALGNFLLLAVFFGTKSQGGFLVFGLLLPLFVFGLPADRRFPVVAHLLLTAAPALLAVNRFLAAVADGRLEFAWLWVLLGLVLTAAGQLGYSRLRRSFLQSRIETHGSRAVLGGFGLVLAGAGIVILTNWTKVQALLKWENFEHRLHYIFTAWEMVLARPLTGWGGGGWAEAYQAFLPYHYVTRQVHGHYLQVGVETGIPGMLLFAAVWGVFLWTAYRLYQKNAKDPGRRTLVWTVALACLAVGIHSALDFNFSLGALALVVWVLFGALAGLEREAGDRSRTVAEAARRKKRRLSSYAPPNYSLLTAAGIAAGLLVCGVLALSVAAAKVSQGVQLLQQGDGEAGLAAVQQAAAYNPFNAEYNYLLAQVHLSRGDHGSALAEIERAVAKSRYNPAYREFRAQILSMRGDYEAATAGAEEALTKAPLAISSYEALVRTYFTAGYGEIQGDGPEAARKYFQAAVAVPARMDAVMAALSDTYKRLWSGPPLGVRGGAMQFPLGAAHYFLGEFEAAAAALEAAAATEDEKARGETLVWLAAVAAARGDTEREAALLAEAGELIPEASQMYAALRELPVLKAE